MFEINKNRKKKFSSIECFLIGVTAFCDSHSIIQNSANGQISIVYAASYISTFSQPILPSHLLTLFLKLIFLKNNSAYLCFFPPLILIFFFKKLMNLFSNKIKRIPTTSRL